MNGRLRVLPVVGATISGAAAGAAATVLLQQFAVLVLTRGVLLVGVVVGAVIGALLPALAGLLAGSGNAGGPPAHGDTPGAATRF